MERAGGVEMEKIDYELVCGLVPAGKISLYYQFILLYSLYDVVFPRLLTDIERLLLVHLKIKEPKEINQDGRRTLFLFFGNVFHTHPAEATRYLGLLL